MPPARRPAPRPPAAARPAELSVTQVERLVRDPYAIYARKVLRLRRLDPPGRKPDALTRGNAIHAALDAFVAATAAGLPAGRRARSSAPPSRAALADARALAGGQRASGPRGSTAPPRWFLDGEAERRARGAPAAREVKGRREVDGPRRCPSPSPPAPTASTALPGGYAIYDYKSGSRPDRPPRRAPSTCSCRSRPRSPRPAASRACRPAPALHLELLELRRPARRLRSTPTPAALAATWARLRRADRPLPRPGERLRRPAPAAAS